MSPSLVVNTACPGRSRSQCYLLHRRDRDCQSGHLTGIRAEEYVATRQGARSWVSRLLRLVSRLLRLRAEEYVATRQGARSWVSRLLRLVSRLSSLIPK